MGRRAGWLSYGVAIAGEADLVLAVEDLDASLTLATPPGDAAAWFWAWDCPYRCNRALLSPGLALS